MNNTSKRIKRALWATGIFLVLTAIVVALFRNHWDRPPPFPVTDTVRINDTVKLQRSASRSCNIIDLSQVQLFINGMNTGLKAVGCNDGEKPTLSFPLRHVQPNGLPREVDQAVWNAILGFPLHTLYEQRLLEYQLKWVRDDQAAEYLTEGKPKVRLQIFRWWSPAVLMLVLYIWFQLGYLGASTTLLRDAASEGTPLAQRTFSLARTQMAWWFAIVFASFIFLWLVTGETPSLSPQALALLGIASVTTMASTGVSAGRTSADGVRGQFFVDLLSDGGTITIHRFQMVVMTMTLGLMFLFSVATTLTMPEFDASLLTLMGLSAGTYVALKIPELRTDTAPPSTPTPATAVSDPKSGYAPTP